MNPKTTYEKYIHGDPIYNKELLEGIEYFKDLSEKLRHCGPIFKLATNELQRVVDGLEGYAYARNLIKPTPEKKPTPDISWKNTLSPDYNHYGWISNFRDKAVEVGYPYFAWNGGVYITKTGEQIEGLYSEDLK